MKLFTTQERNVIALLTILLMVGLAVKEWKKRNYDGTTSLTLIGTNQDIVDYYAGLDDEDIKFAGLVDINSAGVEELTTLPGIGEKTAAKIINTRSEMGGFNTLEDIMQVPGIGNKKFEKISSYIRIH